jgi:Holliday junction resolvasome RuvABC endonuclease subunit
METTKIYHIWIDPSLSNTGMVLVDSKGKVVATCTITTNNQATVEQRLVEIYDSVCDVLYAWYVGRNVESVAIEEPVISKLGGATILNQLQAVWVIKICISKSAHKTYKTVNVQSAKSYMWIRRGQNKTDIRNHVQRIVHWKNFDNKAIDKKQFIKEFISNEHEADAYAITNAINLFYNFKQ